MIFMGWATEVIQCKLQYVAITQVGANHQKSAWFGLQSATRLYEIGIASNRESERHGEIVP